MIMKRRQLQRIKCLSSKNSGPREECTASSLSRRSLIFFFDIFFPFLPNSMSPRLRVSSSPFLPRNEARRRQRGRDDLCEGASKLQQATKGGTKGVKRLLGGTVREQLQAMTTTSTTTER